MIAWGGAYGAHQVSQQSAIAGWHQLHFPSSQMMNLLLEQYQMVHVSDVTLQQRVGRFSADLPAYWQGEQFPRTVWANADLTWVVYDLGWTEGADFEVFRWSETDLSIPLAETGNWKLMGPGWDGLDRVLDRLEKKRERDQIGIERKTPGSPNAKERRILPKSPWRDPREILY